MTFTFTNYAAIPPQRSPFHDLINQVLSGYGDMTKTQFLRPSLEEELKKAKLYNQYYGPNIESEIGLRGAQSSHLGAQTKGLNISNQYLPKKLQEEQQKREFELQNPFFGQTGTSGDLGRLLYLQEMIKKNPQLANQLNSSQEQNIPQEGQSFIPSTNNQQISSPEIQSNNFDYNKLIQNAFNKVAQGKNQQFAPSNLGKLQQEYDKAKSGINPFTNQKFENDQEKEEFLAPYTEKLSGLKQGEHYVYDPETHEKIAIQRPYTPKERETETGRAFFNEVFPTVNNGFKDFIGKDSVKNFIHYADKYGKDPIATQKIDDLLLAQKLTAANIVNEASTLGAGKTNMTYKSLLKSFPGSDIPNLIERYGKEFKLPTEAFIKSGLRFQNILNNATKNSSNSVPATKTIYYHPEKYLKTKEEANSHLEEHAETVTLYNKKTHKTETVSKAEARKRGVPNV
jgi:hypothetical protein